MNLKPSAVALRASLLYAVVGGLWILFSDRLVVQLVRDPALIVRVKIFKGWGFVAFTAVLFFFILRRLLASEREKQQELKSAEALTKLQKDALEMIARDGPLKATLEALTRGIEAQMPGSRASILLLDGDGLHLRHGAAQSLPDAYVKATDGVAIGPKAGSCGTAAFRGSPVLVSDIAQDPLWNDFKHLALPHGLRACWSTPIFDEQKKVLGTFAIYHLKPGLPEEKSVRVVEMITHTAAAAIVKARTEQSLRESEERFRTLVKQASDAIFVHGPDGRLVDANEQASTSLGYSREELLRLTVPDFEVGFSPEEIRDILQSLQPGQFKIMNGRHRRKDGTTFAVETSLSIHHLHGRELTLALVRNATERREYEEKLAHSLSLLRTTIESSASGILVVDLHGKIAAYNQRFLQLWNIPEKLAASAQDETVLEHVLQQLAEPQAFLNRVRELYTKPDAESFDTLLFKDGRVFERSSRPQRLAGKTVGRVWSFWDVTRQRQAEQRLAVSEESYRNFFNTIGDAIFVMDETGKFLAVNDGAVAMYGHAKEDFVGRTPEFLSAPGQNDLDYAMTAVQRAFAGETPQFEWWGRRKNGEIFPKEIQLKKGSYFGRVVVFATGRDLTQRRQAEAELRNERKLLRTLVDLAPDFIFIKDTESRYLMVNSALAACYGQKPGQMLGHADTDFLPAEMAAGFRASELRVLAADSFLRFEDAITFPDGKPRTVVTNMAAFRDGHGKVCGLIGIGRDITGQKVIEKSMRLQSTALEAAANAIMITDHNGLIEWINPAFTRSTGYTRAECLGKNPRELLRSGRHDRAFYQQLWETILAGQVWHGEMVNRRKDGSLFQEEMTITPLLDRENRTEHFIAIRQDITEQKRAEEKFAREQARFKLIFDTMPVGIAFHTIHPDGSVTRLVNDAHLRICGLTREQSKDIQNYINITHPDDRAAQKKLMAEIIASQVKRFTLERRYVHPDQSVVWVNLSFQRETHPDGTIQELTTLVDNTERKAVEQQLVQLAVIVESSEDAIIGKTLAGVITSWNRGAETIFGYSASEAIGNTMLLLFPPELKHEEADILARIARGESVEHFQTERVRKDGKRIRISATVSPLKDGQGGIVGAATIARDITHQHILEEQLRQSQKMEAIGQLAGGVAHDFNNILAVIQMQAELSKVEGGSSPELAACLDEILTAASRGANLTRQLLLFSRRQRLQPRELDLSDSITGMTKMLRRILGEDIHVQFKYAPQPLFIHADAGMMDQVVMNLTLNSRDAMPDGGQLVIETAAVELDELAALQSAQARTGAFVRLSVSDTGCGIAPEILPRIFEPFFTTKDVGKGTGLGLATVFSIVQQHQGWISVESEPGRGTTFHIFLPRLARNSTQPTGAPATLADADGGKETILLVEDDDALRASVHRCLSQLGYRLLEAASGAAALQVWQEHRDQIQLLLTDLVMPGGMSGKELGERLLLENPKLKVIYTSGYNAEVFSKDIAPARGVTFLSKPFPAQTLAQTVRDCLDRH